MCIFALITNKIQTMEIHLSIKSKLQPFALHVQSYNFKTIAIKSQLQFSWASH